MTRHPELFNRATLSSNCSKSTQGTKEVTEKWIRQLDDLYNEGYLNNPAGLWNLHESGFFLGVNRSGRMDSRKLTSYCAEELFPAMTTEKVSAGLID